MKFNGSSLITGHCLCYGNVIFQRLYEPRTWRYVDILQTPMLPALTTLPYCGVGIIDMAALMLFSSPH